MQFTGAWPCTCRSVVSRVAACVSQRRPCRPDACAWQPFPQLSGGQQALAALALSLAVHSTLRPSWFLCDEVDAALDVRRATELAAYMAASPTQFLVISHKPQVRASPRPPPPHQPIAFKSVRRALLSKWWCVS